MSKLTWADVAHYYGQNNPRPDVVISNGRYFSNHAAGYFCERECIDDGDRPVLASLSEITEEDAKAVFQISGHVPDAGYTCKAWFAWQYWEHDTTVQNIQESVLGCPAAIHYLISRNYNVFGIETWKGVQP